MRFGICTGLADAARVKAAGWDYIEANVKGVLAPAMPDDQWKAPSELERSGLPIPAANSLFPAELKLVGPNADAAKVDAYLAVALKRAKMVGIRTLVFGAGGARQLPEGFEAAKGRRQILDFCRRAATAAAGQGITMVIEPLNRGETNTINTVADAMTFVREVNHPNLQCLVDSFHMWLENEPLEHLREAMPWIRHVHVANRDGRLPPQTHATSDYRGFFRVLKEGGYGGSISVESFGPSEIAREDPRVLAFLKKEWDAA